MATEAHAAAEGGGHVDGGRGGEVGAGVDGGERRDGDGVVEDGLRL